MKNLENLCAQVQALYYPPPRYGTLKLSIAMHPELDLYFSMSESLSVGSHLGIAHDAELRLSLSMIDYILANATLFDPRDMPYVKSMRAKGEMSLVHHFTQLLKRPTQEVSAIYAGLQLRSYDTCQSIEEVEGIDPAYVLKALAQSQPLCLRGALNSPLLELGVEQFVERFGHVNLRQNAVSGKQETVADIAAKMRDDSVDRIYLNGVEIPQELEPLVQFPLFEESVFSVGLLWWGGKKTSSPITKLHRDFQASFLAQIWGEKTIQLFSPDQSDELYATQAFNLYQLCQVDPGAPDLVHYPRFADAKPLEVRIGPGDILLIPTGWFHCVWALTDVLSVNRFMKEATITELRVGELGMADSLERHR